jgi:Putative zinc-finger
VPDQNKFGQKPDETPKAGRGTLSCDEWEAMLTDALDGQLSARDLAAFDAHAAGCAGCADLLAHARQGQEWLVFLHSEPEVPAGLVNKILDKTAGAGAIPIPVIAGAAQGTGAGAAIPWRRSFQETRLLMTVAMAFFSTALMLNMAGVKLTSLRLADLRPSTIGNTLSRQFYAGRESVVKFYTNARLMYQLESKMRELRRDTETQQPAPQKKAEPSSRNDEEPGSVLNAQQGSGLRVQGSEQRAAVSVQEKAVSGQRSAVSEEQALENRQPQVVHSGMELRRAETQREQGTEVKELNLQHNEEAGPRRMAAIAGCDGRSLA